MITGGDLRQSRLDVGYKTFTISPWVEDEVYHIQTLNNYVSRWRGWMQKFHGVGTDYLKNYLAWFRVYNQEPNSAKSWLSGGVKIVNNT